MDYTSRNEKELMLDLLEIKDLICVTVCFDTFLRENTYRILKRGFV